MVAGGVHRKVLCLRIHVEDTDAALGDADNGAVHLHVLLLAAVVHHVEALANLPILRGVTRLLGGHGLVPRLVTAFANAASSPGYEVYTASTGEAYRLDSHGAA
jgi:hypothetical protein